MAEIAFTPMILSGVKKVIFTPWGIDDTLDLENDNRYDLQNLVGDTVSVTQDDNDTSEVPCETRDEPLWEVITLGKHQVSMESGDINPALLSVCMGYGMSADGKIAYAPATYVKRYAHLEVVMDGARFIIPRFLISPKTNIETLKTGIARGTIAGTAYSVDISTGVGTKRATPFFVVKGDGVPGEISLLGQGAGTYEEDGNVNSLAVSPSTVSFAKTAGTKIVAVHGNTGTPTVSVASGGTWLTAVYDNGSIALTATANSGTARTTTVTVTDNGVSKTISVSQEAN